MYTLKASVDTVFCLTY